MGSSPSVIAVVDLHLLPVEGGRLAGFVDAYEREGRVLLRPNWQFPRNLWGDLYAAPVITFFTKPASLGAPARAALQPIYAETIPAFFRLAEGDVLLMIEGRVSGVATVVAIEEFANTADALEELQRVYGE